MMSGAPEKRRHIHGAMVSLSLANIFRNDSQQKKAYCAAYSSVLNISSSCSNSV